MKYRLPRFSGASNRCFNRSRFLDGSLLTYFGPGQLPDVVTLPGDPFASEYYPPTDWRPANSILTPPQVVWLTLAQPDAATKDYTVDVTNYFLLEYYSVGGGTGLESTTTFVFSDTTVTLSGKQSADYAQQAESGTVPSFISSHFVIFNKTHQPTVVLPDGSVVSVFGTDGAPRESLYLGYTATDPTNPEPGNFVGLAALPYGTSSAASVTYKNPWYEDYSEMSDAFQGASDTINNLRIGKTWVQVLDFTTASQEYQAYVKANYKGNVGPAGMLPYPYQSNLLSPQSSPSFFGVDFLHIHSGAWASFGSPVFSGYNLTPNSDMISQGEQAVQSSYSQFVRFAVLLYGGDSTHPSIPKQKPIADSGGPGTPILYHSTNTVFSSHGWYGLPDGLSDRPGGYPLSQVISSLNAALVPAPSGPSYEAGINPALEQLASDLSDYGYSYEGDDSDLTSSDSVVQLIADHFGFDPGTGLDL